MSTPIGPGIGVISVWRRLTKMIVIRLGTWLGAKLGIPDGKSLGMALRLGAKDGAGDAVGAVGSMEGDAEGARVGGPTTAFDWRLPLLKTNM